MKKIITQLAVVIVAILIVNQATATGGDTFYVHGNHIYDPCGNQFVPRGINYAVLDDWGFPANLTGGGELSTQIKLAHPNMVRIAWFNHYPVTGRPAFTLDDLDSLLTRLAIDSIVAQVTIGDGGGKGDTTFFRNNIVNWWTSPAVVALINKHKKTMMINIAGEWGFVNDTSLSYTFAIGMFKTAYINAIHSIRNAGIHVPLFIDGPDYANNLPVTDSLCVPLTAADPYHDIIFGVHAYWATISGCDMNDTTTIITKLNFMNSMAAPVMVEETGNIAPSCDGSSQCDTAINIDCILRTCQTLNMGWFYWEWYDDGCAKRMLSSDGTFANLNTIGDTIINNPTYGLATHAIKSPFILHGQTCGTTSISNNNPVINNQYTFYPNPAKGLLNIQQSVVNDVQIPMKVINYSGETIFNSLVRFTGGKSQLNITNIMSGKYFIVLVEANGEISNFKLVISE